MNLKIWTAVLGLLIENFDLGVTTDFNGSYLEVNASEHLNSTETEDYIARSSEFPPSIFTREQLEHGAVILYFMGAMYSFGIIGIVCGDYFLPSVDCICTDLNLSQDVAAATFMSFATTAPELFIILIATFITHSDIGVGAVVGGGMFNILGVATIGGLAARMPIKLDWWPLYRDSLVYMFAPIGLAVVLSDGEVSLIESLCLIIYYFLYFIIMFFNRSIRNQIKRFVKKLKSKQIKKDDKTTEKPPPIVPNISLTLDLTKNDEAPSVQDGNKDDLEDDNGSFKAYFMNYDDAISLRRISACSNASSRSNRSRKKSDRSLNFKKSSQIASASSQSRLGDGLNLAPQKLQEPQKTESINGLVDDFEMTLEKNEESISVNFCTFPQGNLWNKFTWIVLWPPFFILYHTIPDCRSTRWRRFYPLTFLMCVFWIGVSSYFGTWMISVVGETIGVTESVMGLTFLALGGSMPEAISTFIMSRQGEGGLGFSNSLGGNTMDICLCLGVPWLIKSAMEGPIQIKSDGLPYNTTALVVGIIVLLSITTHTKFHMNKTMGFVCFVFYFIFIIISVLIEMEVIEVTLNR